MSDDPIPKEWFWEGNVQRSIARQLRKDGWKIERMANAARRQQGEDILATRDGRTLMVEVKGYPSSIYRDPRRAGEAKPTAPTLQAGHWFGGAILSVTRRMGTHPREALAIGLPDFPRYRALLADTRKALTKLRIGVYLVERGNKVTMTLPHGPRLGPRTPP